ncbi:MAG: hypothetical protein ACK4NP_08200 [Parvularculaceae bacterium]
MVASQTDDLRAMLAIVVGMGVSTVTAIVILCGWLIASAFLTAAYWRAGPIWIERHSLRFKLAGKDRRCSGAIGEMALLAACALLLWAVDATTPEMDFIAVIARHPWWALGALVFVSAIIAAYTASAVAHPDPATKKRLQQTYAIYAPYSTLLFGGGMVLIYCIVTQFIADTAAFNAAGGEIVARAGGAAVETAAGAQRAVEFTYVDAMMLLARAKNQMTPVFIFAIAIFSINLLILYTPMRGLYTTNAVFLTNVSTLVAIGAVAAAGAVLYVVSYNAFIQDYMAALAGLPRELVGAEPMFQRRFTDITLALEQKGSLVGFIGDMSNEWAGLTAIVGVVQAAASRLARKPEIEGMLPTLAFDAFLEEAAIDEASNKPASQRRDRSARGSG